MESVKLKNSEITLKIEKYSKVILERSRELEQVIRIVQEMQEFLRFDSIINLYNKFIINSKNKSLQDVVVLDKKLLSIAIKSYYDDIYRYKLYAQSDAINLEKKSAYLIKWFSKIRPLQIKPNIDSNLITSTVLYANSSFALFIGFTFLYENTDININAVISPEFYKELLYTTQYREICPKQFASIIHTLYNLSVHKNISKTV